MSYIFIAVFFGLAAGTVGKLKGSSFVIWFLIGAIVPFIGLFVALAYRVDNNELRRACPQCGRVVKLHDALCTRCGCELEYPDDPDEILASVNGTTAWRAAQRR